jgi:hypothetical protein
MLLIARDHLIEGEQCSLEEDQPDRTVHNQWRNPDLFVRDLKSGVWLTEFEKTRKFEQKIAEFIVVRHATGCL